MKSGRIFVAQAGCPEFLTRCRIMLPPVLASIALGWLGCGAGSASPTSVDAGRREAEPDARGALDTGAEASPDASDEPTVPHPRFRVDGLWEDWRPEHLRRVDPSADQAPGARFDLGRVWAGSEGTVLFVRTEVASTPLNLAAGETSDGALIIQVELPDRRVLAVDLREHSIKLDGQEELLWDDVGFQMAPTFASTEFEFRIDLARLAIARGDTVRLSFGGSDSLATPVDLKLEGDASPVVPEDPSRAPGAHFRVASLNVQFDGLVDPARRPAITRLLRSSSPDILCLQEVFDASVSQVKQALQEGVADRSWNVHRTGDTLVASPFPLVPVPSLEGEPFTGVGVTISQDIQVVVFTLRPTCCGFSGSPQDQSRVAQLGALARRVRELRAGELAPDLVAFQSAPVIVVGDWNLVGSRAPLDVLVGPEGPGLERVLLRHLRGDGAIHTWHSNALRGFPPGTLDVLVYGSSASGPATGFLGGYVLESEALDEALLTKLGLDRSDSKASDHYMLVADFGLAQ